MPDITQPEWVEVCPGCNVPRSGHTPGDGCYWECDFCSRHFDAEALGHPAYTPPSVERDLTFEPAGDAGEVTGALPTQRICSSCYQSAPIEETEDWLERATPFNLYYCSNCARTCDTCGSEDILLRNEACPNCTELVVCAGCSYEWYPPSPESIRRHPETGDPFCGPCVEEFVCDRCGGYDDRGCRWSDFADERLCRRCRRTVGIEAGEEEFDADATVSNERMRIEPIPGREAIRLCGVEIEGGDGTGSGEDLAQAFYAAELSTMDEVGGYHSGRRGDTGFAHVEHDSSVDWEAVIGPVDPARRGDVSQLNRAVREIRTLVHEGVLTLDLRCGLHIHIGAEKTGIDSSFNLSVLFGYIEDVIFRLGAARWPVHRSIQNDHYSQPIPKTMRKLEFARTHAQGGDEARYYALSFNNYFNAVFNNCRCGAIRYDSWEDCTCDLGKCTFEFRLFNTTANPRKLHAYLALCQALVAKAISLGKQSDADLAETYPALSFERRRFKDMGEPNQESLVEEWQTRLLWMFTELPLTDDEKESIAYCIRHSELAAVGEDFINELTPTAEAVEEEVA